MKKRLVPELVEILYFVIPMCLPLLSMACFLLDKLCGCTGIDWATVSSSAVDIWSNLSFGESVYVFSAIGVVWSFYGFIVQTIWGLGSIAVFKFIRFLHNRKTPR